MKKVLGKATGIIMAAVMALTIVATGKVDDKAATAINLNQEYNVKISGHQEYTFTTPNKGTIQIEAVLVDNDSDFWNNYIETKLTIDYTNYISSSIHKDYGREYFDEIIVRGDQTATLVFDGRSDKSYNVVFKVTSRDLGNMETENNNNAGSADKIKLKKTYNGIVNGADRDVDWFVFKAPKTGKYKFSLVNTQTSGCLWVSAEGYKSKTKKDNKNSFTLRPGEGWSKSSSIKLKKGKKYYIKLSNSGLWKTVPYQIKVKKVK